MLKPPIHATHERLVQYKDEKKEPGAWCGGGRKERGVCMNETGHSV